MINFPTIYKPLISYIFLITLISFSLGSTPKEIINIKVTPSKPQAGDTVKVEITTPGLSVFKNSEIRAVLLKPSLGSGGLSLIKDKNKHNVYHGQVILSDDATKGLYAVHAWAGDKDNPAAVGKATFLFGKIIADFLYPSTIDSDNPDRSVSQYLQDFREIGGNFLIAHGLIGRKAHFPSKICKTDIAPGSPQDIVEAILRHGDKKGFPVLLSVSWDLTGKSHSKDRMSEIKFIMKELYTLYNHHPSLTGFYTYLEGSGTYFAPFLREFCDHVKSLNPGLLSGCAPYVDDPMLAGYIGIIESLDIIIFQGMVMASYRPDNRKKYPIRRVKDFSSLGMGAKYLQNKIALTHVELFGYLENRISKDHCTTTYENIYPQILSAATAAGSDGISFFTYSSNIFANSQKKYPEIRRSRQAVADGMKAFDLIWENISKKPNNLTVYFPHSDWVIERWFNYFLPALDAFRNLGVPVDILPYAPPLNEDYPYWPNHANEAVCPRLLKNNKIIIIPNISGLKRTDSDWIKDFVEQGGAVIAFGPQIPMARSSSYERKELFGVEEAGTKEHASIIIKETAGKRVFSGDQYSFPSVQLPLWKRYRGKVIAGFEDGSPAVIINTYGKGTVVTVALDAAAAARQIPELIRDVIDYATAVCSVTRPADILGTNENVDVAITKTNNGFRAAVVNHNPHKLDITLKALDVQKGAATEWYNLISQKKIDDLAGDHLLKISVPGSGFICIEFKQTFVY